ncbi:MAG: tRNA guanosine(34) transglycosylase Tgt [Candidatus Harrisonbacteria bacterium]|nr:tRNA guanosine(34) transglycosylase Tgt [Candidatus Harrisonbacteria bacterium]
MIDFRILKKSRKSNARLGILQTPHGEVETPALVPVATQAVVKTLTSEEALKTNTRLLIANTFHLHLKPGEHIVKKAGGLHEFMQWPRPLMTDSAGYQVFSLGFGRDYGTGKILKEKRGEKIVRGAQPKLLRITEDGVRFRTPFDGAEIFIGPRESIKIQEKLGADMMFAFDECTSPIADEAYTRAAMERTHRWAKVCLAAKKSNQALYGIVQGGKFKKLRQESAAHIGALPFDGFGIGGEFGDNKKTMSAMLRTVIKELPNGKPRHLLGIGHLEDIVKIVHEGVDTFDCTAPTHYARHGVAFTSRGRLEMRKMNFMTDQKPLDPKCGCEVCGAYTRSYITHLLRAGEITALRLLTFHNLHYFNAVVADVRKKIKQGKI